MGTNLANVFDTDVVVKCLLVWHNIPENQIINLGTNIKLIKDISEYQCKTKEFVTVFGLKNYDPTFRAITEAKLLESTINTVKKYYCDMIVNELNKGEYKSLSLINFQFDFENHQYNTDIELKQIFYRGE